LRKTNTIKWLEKAADMGSTKALYLLYNMLYWCRGTVGEYACTVLTEAAMCGDIAACGRLAYNIELELEAGDSLVKRWFKKALQCEMSTECDGVFGSEEEDTVNYAESYES
jgi:TPR repeat protein